MRDGFFKFGKCVGSIVTLAAAAAIILVVLIAAIAHTAEFGAAGRAGDMIKVDRVVETHGLTAFRTLHLDKILIIAAVTIVVTAAVIV